MSRKARQHDLKMIQGLATRKQNQRRQPVKEDLKRIIDKLTAEDLYILYVTALEMLRDEIYQ